MANIITLIRIVLAISLLFIKKYSPLFLIVYSICGFTDILDGYIARKTKTESIHYYNFVDKNTINHDSFKKV